jgi:hypothetical protein
MAHLDVVDRRPDTVLAVRAEHSGKVCPSAPRRWGTRSCRYAVVGNDPCYAGIFGESTRGLDRSVSQVESECTRSVFATMGHRTKGGWFA